MWPLDGLRSSLPDSFSVSEDPEFVVLRCHRCGWTVTFSTTGVSTQEIIREAKAHRC